ncbi:outer membrane protein assembly factor [Nannocystis sp. SCPEA4]|uniref:BamA/TamA family outer membrane protein n=1 Tax=Nannocystis sp. SCPEA4 TaxID=2996787 RepID=UPI00226FFD49|nr:outer membrane protein assembly factor [Nannocystis sp. SCPEA4]MCY1058130.1 BamA/TamA family outer membrane protein [Nannocystis sp. SCPEA4]
MNTSFPACAERRAPRRLALVLALAALWPVSAGALAPAPKASTSAPGPVDPAPKGSLFGTGTEGPAPKDMQAEPAEPAEPAAPAGIDDVPAKEAEPDLPPPEDSELAPPTTVDEVPVDTAPPISTSTGNTCARFDGAADPLVLIDNAIDNLRDAGGFTVGPRERETSIRGTICAVRLTGKDHALLYYQLEHTADEGGYLIVLEPKGADEVELTVRTVLEGEDRGVVFGGVERVRVVGEFLSGDDGVRLRKILDLGRGTYLLPAAISAQLQQLGYRSEFEPEGAGQLTIRVDPGQSIRRVRIRGHLPLSKTEVQRELSINSRPGALARGRCLGPRQLRRAEVHPSPCEPGDAACMQWERDETERLRRYLYDKGYLRGTASLSLACGRARDEVDLYVYLDKGPAFRVPLRQMEIVGNMPEADKRWIRRAFWPRVKATPFPARITRERVDDSKERTERQYAEPRDSLVRQTAVSQLTLPYPQIQIDTSYDDLKPEDIPKTGKLPLKVTVDLGRGVKTSFIGNRSYTDQRLRSELQLFSRREAPSAQTAQREAANLRSFYQTKGFLLAEVKGRYDEFGSTAPGSLTFQIKEGPVVRMKKLDLRVGRGVPRGVRDRIEREFADERVLRAPGTFTEAAVVDHLSALLAKFADAGYLCATGSVRVAFWPDGLDKKGEYAEVDVDTILRRDAYPAWATRDLDASGLASLLKLQRAELYVRVTVEPGPRVFTSRQPEVVRYLETMIPGDREVEGLPHNDRGEWGATRMLRGTALRRKGDDRPGNIPLTISLDRDAEQGIIDNYRNDGFPVADAELRWLYTDPRTKEVKPVPNARRLVDPEIGLCQAHPSGTAVEVGTEISVYEGRPGVFGDTVIRGNFKTHGWILRRQFAHKAGGVYSRARADESRANVDGLDVAESTELTAYPTGCDLDDDPGERCTVHQVLEMRESKDVSVKLQGGVGLATLDPFYVFLHPEFPNVFGTAWDFDVLGHYGFDTKGFSSNVPFLGDCAGQSCYERSVRGRLARPRIFATPLTLEINGQYQYRVTPARGPIELAVGNITLSYSRSRELQLYVGYLIQKSNISQDVTKPAFTPMTDLGVPEVVNRRDAIVSDRTGALTAGFTYNNTENPSNPEKGIIIQGDLRFASPYFGGQDWFLRADLAYQQFIPIPRTNNRLSFRYALRYGHAIPLPGLRGLRGERGADGVPEIWRYWGGGTADLGLRGIFPETMLVDIEEIDTGDGFKRLHYTAQGGHIRALASIALQVTSLTDFLGGKIHHSLFFDFGILAQKWSQVQFARDFRRSVGINFIKWDIKLVTLALGYAILLPNSIAPGNVKPIDDRNGRFIFDVGITF